MFCINFLQYNYFIFVSFGQSGIFLLGGPSKSVKPSAMLISNGDIVVMAGIYTSLL